jgi:hypothetical protein
MAVASIVQIFPKQSHFDALVRAEETEERGKLGHNPATRCALRHNVHDALASSWPPGRNKTVGHAAFARPSNWPESKQDYEGLRNANAGKSRFSA